MSLAIVSDPTLLGIRDPKVHPDDRPLISSSQFPQPLMRNEEIASDRHRKHAAGKITVGATQATDAVAVDQGDPRFGSKMYE